ncbi:hypothetical protein O3M35_005544 [Rhynocoris fuscipes]|uniref:Olfactory receptor n=1 Tax=Rhynocoris fuscipes TaxID=488301 RepID=A0AAW1DL87_9HEMI
MGESLHYAVLFFSTLAEVTTALFNRSQIEHIMRTLGSGVYDYGDTLDEDSINEIKKVTSKAKVNKNFFSKVYIGMIVSAATIISFLKTTVMAFSENNDEFYIKTDGINREMPISCWYPFDHRITYVNVLCHIVQRMAAYFAIAAVIATDILYLCVSEETIAQLKIAGITMRNAVKRAKYVMKSNNDGDMRKCISICLSHSIKHQITILRLIESLRIYYFYLVLVLMSGGAILICLSGFVFTLNSTLNRNEIYDSDWLNYSAEMRYYMLMIVNKSFKPKTLSIGGFAELSMATYANVLSSAYSYFNLLNATK